MMAKKCIKNRQTNKETKNQVDVFISYFSNQISCNSFIHNKLYSCIYELTAGLICD